ncbi:Protein-N(pi)-phosphohistidine--sugar phosphotransferase [Sphingobium sp. EP60837]|jgi:nitrogen PTS system EIIA component|nr:Protein-N(pi)-phosphohistidine--sugar phosphotransferase [Sphingobium sp. EP60837]
MGPGFISPGNARFWGMARLGCSRLVMVHFNDIVAPDALATGLSVNGKKPLFQKIAQLAAAAYGLKADMVSDALSERERLGSTGFGGGIAIPHAKIAGLQKMRAVVVLLRPPLTFDAVDDAPVDVVFALLSPVDSGAEHLKTLARVSRYLREDAHVARLRGAKSAEALHALLAGGEARDAA